MDVLRFRNIPVLHSIDRTYTSEPDTMIHGTSHRSAEAMVADIYRWYEEILIHNQHIKTKTHEYIFHMDRMRRDEESRPDRSNCDEFLYFFSRNHAALTNFTGWSGGDTPSLHYVFHRLVYHFQKQSYWLSDHINELEMEFCRLVEY